MKTYPIKKTLFITTFTFAIISSILIIITSSKINWDNSLTLLAGQLLKGHISLNPAANLPLGDIAFFNGKFYLYFGVFPSLVLLPFVAIFGTHFPQVFIGIFSMVVSFVSVFFISKKFKFDILDSLFLSLFFTFSTVLFSSSLINISAYQVEVLGVPLILLSLLSYFYKKNFLITGLFIGLAFLTRTTLFLAAIFFVFEFIQKRITKNQLILFFTPLVVCLLIMGSYNFLRFNSFFESGYSHLRKQPFPLSRNYEFGAFSPIHIPGNLYSFLILPPQPLLYFDKGFVLKFPYLKASPWGMAIWFTSPLFLYLILKFRKNKYALSSSITAICLAIPVFLYFSIGFSEFGYRYALDFLPFLFLILIPALTPKLSKAAIALIIIGVLFNGIYIMSLWNIYPIFGIFKPI